MTRLFALGVCPLAVWGLVMSCISAEKQYFLQSKINVSWADAQRHCQRCFSELVTLTPENIENITRRLSSEHWIGLRKRPWRASSNTTLYSYNNTVSFWTHWVNGDPLTFQNWYPGYPVFKSPYPRKQCCDCSCTCPAQPSTTTPATVTTANHTTHNITFTPFGSECVSKPLLFQHVADPDENYIEDPCVAMQSSGTWVEKECSELLPYICSDDRFEGNVNAKDIKSTSAIISWDRGPDTVSHYNVSVNGEVREENHTDTNYSLTNLTAGTLYSVQVFPVKCGRALDPAQGTFYTVPHKVTDLSVTNQTEKCISLSWTKPKGNVDLYFVQTKEASMSTKTESAVVCGLTSGSRHTFKVSAGVKDESKKGKISSIDAYTKPAQVSNLRTAVTNSSVVLEWDAPEGGATGYLVSTSWEGKGSDLYISKTTQNKLTLEDLPSGTKITLSVTALSNDTLEGKSKTVFCYTRPDDIFGLILTSTENTINATWNIYKGSPRFTVKLSPPGGLEETFINTSDITLKIEKLKSAASYTVTVYSVTEDSQSLGVSNSIFTLPNPPRDAKAHGRSKTSLTFIWTPPENTQTVQYLVTLHSSFWGQKWEKHLNNVTTHTFDNLKSGSSYTFNVQTKAGDLLSDAETLLTNTESETREITLSMVCSSDKSLYCDSESTRDNAFQKLNSEFETFLGNHVTWTLKRMDTNDDGN